MVAEAFVAWLWEQRLTRRVLQTLDGTPVQVVYPGWHWGSWGPDFRSALLSIGGELQRGDVEIHVRAADWLRHGHAVDPAYTQTILHVVLDSGAVDVCFRNDGIAVPTLALRDQIEEPLPELLARWGNRSNPAPEITCLAPDVAGIVLDQAGLRRFRSKAARFEADLTVVSPEQVLWTGVLEALGYTRNVGPFRRLAERVVLLEGRVLAQGSPDVLEAVLMGEAGLLPSQRDQVPFDQHSSSLEDIWVGHGRDGPGVSLGWTRVGSRPANDPVRRVAAAASLLTESPQWLDADGILAVLHRDGPEPVAMRRLRALFTRSGSAYWRSNHDFGRPLGRPSALLGGDRAAAIIVNVVLPWAAAVARVSSRDDVVRVAEAAYRTHPVLSGNYVTRHMATQILGSQVKSVMVSACRQQGLIEVYRGWCDGRDCTGCPAGPGANSWLDRPLERLRVQQPGVLGSDEGAPTPAHASLPRFFGSD